MQPRFSILLPTHNRADVVGYAIRSVLQQTEQDFELLVVGDGCTDETASLVQEFRDPRIRWFDLPKAPHFGYANRNVALREARGDFIGFMAHDDLLTSDHLSLLVEPFSNSEIEWVYSRPLWVSGDGVIIPFAVDLTKPPGLDVFLHRHNTIPASCVMHRRSCFDRYGYWPEDVPAAADWALWKKIVGPSQGSNIAYLRQATTLHFRANWKNGRIWGPPPLDAWLRVANDQVSWPSALRVPVPHGEREQAVFWHLLETDPDGWTAKLRAGISEAIDLLAWQGSTDPMRVVQVARSMAVACYRQNQFGQSLLIADEALMLDPDDFQFLWIRGASLVGLARHAEAETALRRLIGLDPTLARAHGQLSRALHGLGRTLEAIDAAKRGIELNPEASGLQHHLGNLYVHLESWPEAETALAEAVRLDPESQLAVKQLHEVRQQHRAERLEA